MNFETLVLFLMTVIFLGFWLLVLLKGPKEILNRVYSIFILNMALWSFGLGMFYKSHDPRVSLFWADVLYLAGSIIPAAFLHFSFVFPSGKMSISRFKQFLIYVPNIILFYLFFFTPIIVRDITPFGQPKGFVYGPGHIIWDVQFDAISVWGFVRFFMLYRKNVGIEKMRLKYIIMGTLIGVILAGTTNVIMPWFNRFELLWLGPPLTLTWLICVVYAILKYRLMNIDVVIKKGVTDILLFFAMGIISLSILFGIDKYSDSIVLKNSVMIFLIILFSYLFRKLKPATEKKVERMLFKDKYDYLESITQLGKKVINLDQLLGEIVRTLASELSLDDVSIYLYREETNNYYLAKDFDSDREKPNRFSVSSPSILFMNAKKKIIIWKEESFAPDSFKGMMISMLSGIGVAISIPLVYEGKMIGLMNLSDKKTKETWTNRDLNLLNELSERIVWDLAEVQKYGEIEKLYKVRSRHERITSLAEMSGGLCHQLNNPLTPIKGFLQLVGKEGHKIEDLGVLKGEAEKAVDRIVKIIKEVRTFSETGVTIAHIESNVNAVLRKAVPLIVGAGPEPALTIDLDENLPTILGDERALLDIFVAIGTNGIEAMFERRRDKNANARDLLKSGIPPEALVKMGILADVRDAEGIMVQEEEKKENKLTIRTRWVTSRTSQVTSYVQVEITDTGEGIKPEDLSKIFNPMHSTKSMHIGLSLAIAHRLVEAHGGYMEVKSKVGEGTSFFINLPLAYNPSMKETTQNKEAQRSGQKAWEAVGA